MGARAKDDHSSESSVTITEDGEWFVATDEETGVASQGETRPEALANLAEAIVLHESDGEEIEDPDAFLEELGVDFDETGDEHPPWLDT